MKLFATILFVVFSASCALASGPKDRDIIRGILPIKSVPTVYEKFSAQTIRKSTIECEEGAISFEYTIYDKTNGIKLLRFNTECDDFGSELISTVNIYSEIYLLNGEFGVGSDLNEIIKNHKIYETIQINREHHLPNLVEDGESINYLDKHKNIGLVTNDNSNNPEKVREIYIIIEND